MGALSSFVEQGSMDHAAYAQMQHLSPRIKLSMALEREKLALQNGGKPIDFPKLLHPTWDCGHKKGRKLYGGLSAFSRRFVTTNYDRWLDTPILLPTTGTQESGPRERAVELKLRRMLCRSTVARPPFRHVITVMETGVRDGDNFHGGTFGMPLTPFSALRTHPNPCDPTYRSRQR
jgi:hypothetical protein